MNLYLKGKRALVTGSTSGIGAEIAMVLASEGVSVVIHGRNVEGAEKAAEDIRKAGGTVAITFGDLTNDNDAERVASEAEKAFGGIDILVNNAGGYPITGWWDTPSDVWLETYNLDVVGGVRLIKLLVPKMVENGWGRVIQVTSAAATQGTANFFPQYASAKASELRVVSSLAVDLAGTGVTVNSVSPGAVATETFKNLYIQRAKEEGRSTSWKDVEKWWIDQFMPEILVRRFVSPKEIADMTTFLVSPCADAITGSDFVVDGGLRVTGFKRQPSQFPKSSLQTVNVQH
jgi:3-oxoacyl-[acyl-carrier protein] reductase